MKKKYEIEEYTLVDCMRTIHEIIQEPVPDARDILKLSGILIRVNELKNTLCKKRRLELVFDTIGYCVFALLRIAHERDKKVFMLIDDVDIELGRLFSFENGEYPSSVELYKVYLAKYFNKEVPDYGRVLPVFVSRDYCIGWDNGYCSGEMTEKGIKWNKDRSNDRFSIEFIEMLLGEGE